MQDLTYLRVFLLMNGEYPPTISYWHVLNSIRCRSDLERTREESFETHIWMLTRLIERCGSDTRSLSGYVIATCYERMLMRLNYRTSESYLNALKKLPRFDFPEKFPKFITTGNNFSDEHFVNRLAEIESDLETPITKLMQHRGNLHNEETYMQRLTHIPDNLYNEETYMDFNTLLCELFKKLSDALVELRKHQKEAKGELSVKNVKSLRKQLSFISSIGTVLRLMVKSPAMKKHLHAIVAFLPSQPAGVKRKEDEKEDGEWAELGCESQSRRTGKACRQWLNLMVIYFDAVLVLSQFAKTHPSIEIAIKVLLQPLPPQHMMPWKVLLRHKQYFPSVPEQRPSANEIIRFLEPIPTNWQMAKAREDGVSNAAIVELLKGLRRLDVRANMDTFTSTIDTAMDQLTRLKWTTPVSEPFTKSIIQRLDGFKSMLRHHTQDDVVEEITEIAGMIMTLSDNTMLGQMLEKGSALDTGTGFLGSCHCEVCVACYCLFMQEGWTQSVRCFPYSTQTLLLI